MKKLLLITTILTFIFTNSFSQGCPNGDLNISRQSQIDSIPVLYPGCSVIKGDVTIMSGLNITNLNGFSQIKQIEGHLWINFNPQLTSLKGLHNLITIGKFLELTNNDVPERY